MATRYPATPMPIVDDIIRDDIVRVGEELYPSVFSDHSSALPVELRVCTEHDSTVLPSALVMVLSMTIVGGVLPLPVGESSHIAVDVRIRDSGGGEVAHEMSAFRRSDVMWVSALTPLGLLPVPGRSDRPRVIGIEGAAREASWRLTLECYVAAILRAVRKAGIEDIPRSNVKQEGKGADAALP